MIPINSVYVCVCGREREGGREGGREREKEKERLGIELLHYSFCAMRIKWGHLLQHCVPVLALSMCQVCAMAGRAPPVGPAVLRDLGINININLALSAF